MCCNWMAEGWLLVVTKGPTNHRSLVRAAQPRGKETLGLTKLLIVTCHFQSNALTKAGLWPPCLLGWGGGTCRLPLTKESREYWEMS